MSKELKKETFKPIGEGSDGFTCKLCFKFYDESEGRMGKAGMICENCDEELDFENSNKGDNEQKTNTFTTLNTLDVESKKTNEKSKELSIKDIEELNQQIIIPSELNIIDCPDIVNPNPEWFRIQFRNFWRLFTSDSEWVFIIHDRGTGKSKQTAIHELYQIAICSDGKYEGCFIMRNRDEPTRQVKEYFNKVIREFDETIWKGTRIKAGQFHLQWNAIWKGVQFKRNPTDKKGDLKCHFLDLFSPEQARTLINNPIKTVFFDECIPTRNQINEGKGWKFEEAGKYMEAIKSLGRLTKPKKVFTGNPNDSWRSCWMLTLHFSSELKALERWYWKERPNNFAKWLDWTWTKEFHQGNKILQLKKIARTPEDFPTYEDDNWDNFFQKPEDLKIVDHKNGAVPQYIFNQCVCYISKQNYLYFIHSKSKEISERDRKILPDLVEYYVNDEQRLRSKQFAKWDYRGEKGIKFQQNLLRLYETNQLFFADMIAKQLMEEFIGKRKTAG